MINPSERTSLKRWAVIAAAAFALLLCLEIATEQDDITILDVVVDAMGLLLIVLAAAGTAVVAIRFEARNQDISLLVSEHAATIADRERWRSKAETHLKGR